VTVGPSFSNHPFESPRGLLTIVDAVAFGSISFEMLGVLGTLFVNQLGVFREVRKPSYLEPGFGLPIDC
jgi:hypothetical protein